MLMPNRTRTGRDLAVGLSKPRVYGGNINTITIDMGVRFLSVLRSLGVLNTLSVVLPEPSLTPLQMAELEGKSLPKRVRSVPKKTKHRWGDEHA